MSEKMYAELALKLECNVGEGPFWDDVKQDLYFVDIMNKQIKMFSPTSKLVETVQFNQEIGAVFLDQKSNLHGCQFGQF